MEMIITIYTIYRVRNDDERNILYMKCAQWKVNG